VSVQAIAWVLEHSSADGYLRLVLLSVANHAKADGTGAWPSYETISKEAGISRRRAISCVQRLEQAGLLRVMKGAGPKGRTGRPTNLYEVMGLAGNGDAETPSSSDAPSPLAASNGDARASNGDAGDVLMVTGGSPEPSTEPSLGTNTLSAALRKDVKNALAEVWTGTTTLTPSAWLRVEQAVPDIEAVGVGPAAEVGATLDDIPDGIRRLGELWATLHAGVSCPPQTVAREWPRFLSGKLAAEADIAEAHTSWVNTVKRRIGVR
jgi:hypothetical protein